MHREIAQKLEKYPDRIEKLSNIFPVYSPVSNGGIEAS